jgi:hypothetical protein
MPFVSRALDCPLGLGVQRCPFRPRPGRSLVCIFSGCCAVLHRERSRPFDANGSKCHVLIRCACCFCLRLQNRADYGGGAMWLTHTQSYSSLAESCTFSRESQYPWLCSFPCVCLCVLVRRVCSWHCDVPVRSFDCAPLGWHICAPARRFPFLLRVFQHSLRVHTHREPGVFRRRDRHRSQIHAV